VGAKLQLIIIRNKKNILTTKPKVAQANKPVFLSFLPYQKNPNSHVHLCTKLKTAGGLVLDYLLRNNISTQSPHNHTGVAPTSLDMWHRMNYHTLYAKTYKPFITWKKLMWPPIVLMWELIFCLIHCIQLTKVHSLYISLALHCWLEQISIERL